MNQDFRIFVVDDVPATRHILLATLGKDYAVEAFASAEECLQRLEGGAPQLFLLDVGLPAMDGYELCRQIRQRPEGGDVPVMFISGLDDLESRLKGYDAGGQDFIVKPYKMAELKQKIEVIHQGLREKAQLRQMASDSEMLTSLVLSNLDEYAVLIKFLRELNACATPREAAAALLAMAQAYRLPGAVQVRMEDAAFTVTPQGESNPLEESVINHIRNDGRIVSFKSRSAFNFDHVSLLVSAMPVDDPERLGRLRDHLAIAVECAEGRLLAIDAAAANRRTRGEISGLADSVCRLMDTFRHQYDHARIRGTTIAERLPFELSKAFGHLGLSDEQEEEIQAYLERRASELTDVFDLSGEMTAMLTDLERKLRTMVDN